MKIINEQLLNEVQIKAKESLRLRMNYNFHQSLEDKCHCFLKTVELGTVVPRHKHSTKDESFVILRGRVRVSTYDDEGNVVDRCVLCQEEGRYGVEDMGCGSETDGGMLKMINNPSDCGKSCIFAL